MEINNRKLYTTPEIDIVITEHLLDTEMVRTSFEVFEGDAKAFQMDSVDDSLWGENELWGLDFENDFILDKD